MKSIPIGRKHFSPCLEQAELSQSNDSGKSQKQKEQIRGYKEDQKKKIKIREELEKSRNRWLKNQIETDKDRVKRWEDEVGEDDIAPI